jgi:hypothetical protein
MKQKIFYEGVLAKIAKATKKLNDRADAASRLLTDIEKKLIDSGVGITVWDNAFLEEYLDDVSYGSVRRYFLGYAKIDGEWGIAVSEEIDGGPNTPPKEFQEFLLRTADRETRILAVPHIPSLLQRIHDSVSDMTKKLDKRMVQMELELEMLSKGKKIEPEEPQTKKCKFKNPPPAPEQKPERKTRLPQ